MNPTNSPIQSILFGVAPEEPKQSVSLLTFLNAKAARALRVSLILLAVAVAPLAAQERAVGDAALTAPEAAVVKTDNPRDTMRSFVSAMRDYRKGVESDDAALRARIGDAVRTLNLEDTPFILRKQKGEEAAILLIEAIDRIIVVDFDKVPAESENPEQPLLRWRLRNTNITIARVETGERVGEYLFTQETVFRAGEFYEAVKDRPYLEGSGQGALYKEPWFEKHIPDWMREEFLILNWWQWVGIFAAILLGLSLRLITRNLMNLVKRLTKRSETDWDDRVIDAVQAPVGFLAAVGFWFLALLILQFEGTVLSVFTIALQILLGVGAIWLVYGLAGILSDYLTDIAAKTESTLDDQLVPLLTRTLRIFIVIIGVLIVIQNMGVNVLSLLAGLGIGGLAFALAARDAVANFFGSLMILFDRPFQVGDWIRVGGSEGTVEEIGFRSTRIRTFYNSVISIPNSEVANEQIDNMGVRQFRRAVANLGVTYDTPPDTLEAFMEGIKNIIKANPSTRKDYFHVVFKEFGDSALVIMVYFFFKVPDWNNELVERQNIYLEILRLAKELKVEFAYPTQTLHVESFPEKRPTRGPSDIPGEKMAVIAKDFGSGGARARPAGSGLFTPPFKE
ncbi:MAG: mechanosensitive ion channel family protein [Leptospirales bacterium]